MGDQTHSFECYQWHHECAIAEVERLRTALKDDITELESVINPSPPPPLPNGQKYLHASSFGSTGAGIVEGMWKEWAMKRQALLRALLPPEG